MGAPHAGPEEVQLVVTTRAYEIMIIVDGDEEDAKVDEIVQSVDIWIQGQNGQIATTDKWGKRKFAYELSLIHI